LKKNGPQEGARCASSQRFQSSRVPEKALRSTSPFTPGTVPASAVSAIIPGASGDFDATYAVTSDGELRQASLTGEFYAGHPDTTYTMVLTDYGTSKDVTAP